MNNQPLQGNPIDRTIVQNTVQSSGSNTPSKEVEPIQSQSEHMVDAGEYEVPKEVAHVISVPKNTADIPPDVQQQGVEIPPDQKPVSAVATTSNSLPLTDDQIGEGLAEKPTSGFRWLAEWCLLQIKKMHMHLKKIHGHFVRLADAS